MSDAFTIPFEQAFIAEPVGKRKIKESEYEANGSICVVDQGQCLISGRTSRRDLLIDDGPYIVFGDHTRVVKYVDFPFVAGADGVRLYKAAPKFNPEYLYFFLRSAELPADGYGRHSKYLQELEVPDLGSNQQRQIATRLKAQLAEVETAREAAQLQLRDARLLNTKIVDSVFDQFEEWQPIAGIAKVQSGYAFKSESFKPSGVRLLRNANILPGGIYWDDVVYLDPSEASRYPSYVLEEGDVLISLDRPLISSGIKVARVGEADLPALLLQRVGRFVLKPDEIDADFLYAFLQSSRFIDAISGHDQSLGVPHISPGQVESVDLPLLPLDGQRRIVTALKKKLAEADTLRAALEQQLRDLDALPQRILALAFEN